MKFRRVLLKLSGELLQSEERRHGIDAAAVRSVSDQLAELVERGTELALVIGGGNLFRGAQLQQGGMERICGDQIGMLATMMNALALGQGLGDALGRRGIKRGVRILSAIGVEGIFERYRRRLALDYIDAGETLIFCGGTGNPLFTTDTAACLRAIEIRAELVAKATHVDGVYTGDPRRDPNAQKFDEVSCEQVIRDGLQVMDAAAISLCRDHALPLAVFAWQDAGALVRLLEGARVGTLVVPT